MKENLEKYYKLLKEQKLLGSTISLLEWDQETKMPEKNADYRSDQLAFLSKINHEAATDKEFVNTVNELFEDKENLEQIDKRSIEYSKKELDKVVKLPTSFVEEYTKIKSLGHHTWIDAKSKEDFSLFKPALQKLIDLTKKYAEYIDSSKPIYNVLLDDFEEEMTSEQLISIFDPLKNELKTLIKEVQTSDSKVNAFNSIKYEDDSVESLIVEMVGKIGFDFTKGTVGRVHHPFETSLSPNDIRINMSYYHKELASTITGAIHELGHGLYEQNVEQKYHDTSLNHGVSLGFHESQSRLLENMIGRSRPFWEYFIPVIEKHFQSSNQKITLNIEEVLNQLNRVEPSLIRIEADEVTYNLHIIIRFETELAMLESDFNLDDLPELWNSKYEEYLGIRPDKLSSGVLQDVHWSMGAIGYFPTYSLGNIIAGQLWNKFTNEHLDWSDKVSNGDFTQYFEWFKNNVWTHGSFYKPKDLMKQILSEELNSSYLVNYLKAKYK